MSSLVKICGLSTVESLDAALAAGADMVGFVSFPRSPRHISLEIGAALSRHAAGRATRVALVVNPSDAELDALVPALDPDLIQLHGAETPDRVAQIRARHGRPVMKAVGVAQASDLDAARSFGDVADLILFDAKPPPGPAGLPGGNGLAFDWRLVAGLDLPRPFMLSGGLDPANVGEAIRLTGIRGVDVSSGVESAPGQKDPDRIAAFTRAARAAFGQSQQDEVA
jgi:phosphoribosylanthranilate isomerase